MATNARDALDLKLSAYLLGLRARIQRAGGWAAERLQDDRPADATVPELAREMGETDGKVRGSLKRLQAAGLVAEDRRRVLGRGIVGHYAHTREAQRAEAAARAERDAELAAKHGSPQAYAEALAVRYQALASVATRAAQALRESGESYADAEAQANRARRAIDEVIGSYAHRNGRTAAEWAGDARAELFEIEED